MRSQVCQNVVLMLPKCLKIGWIVLTVGNIKADPDQTQRWLTTP